jgi:GTP-binding protein Era
MMQSVREAMDGMDGMMVLVDATQVGEHDRSIVKDMASKKVPKVLLLNKIDLLQPEKLLALIASFADCGYDAIIPISAKTGDGLEQLTKTMAEKLPEGPKYFPDDMMTDQPERLIVAEMIREKALLHLRDEVPHGIGVEIMGMNKESDDFMEIHATIYCERDAHKGIIIGKRGAMLQQIGTEARHDIENLLDLHVNLKLWVKVRPDWRNRMDDLRNLGYESK